MRKYLVWPDGHELQITPLSFEEWKALGLWTSADDTSWKSWLYKNNLHEIDSFNDEALDEARFVVRTGYNVLVFNPSGDGETWIDLETDAQGMIASHQTSPIDASDHMQLILKYKPEYIAKEDR